MNGCMTLPVIGGFCKSDLTIELMGYSLNLLHPGVITTLLLGSALYIYVFRTPT